jgi:hypothetical protein
MEQGSTAAAIPELNVGDILSNGISMGLKNFVSLLLTFILFAITFWIPYLNIGMFIALQDIVPKISRGETVSPTSIYDEKYRKNMGEFFLLAGLQYAGVAFGYVFLIGGVVIALSWMLAMPLFVDKGTGPIESLRLSNKATYGNKAAIFMSLVALYIGIMVIILVLMQISQIVGAIVAFLLMLVAFPIGIGMQAYVYGKLVPALDLNMDSGM